MFEEGSNLALARPDGAVPEVRLKGWKLSCSWLTERAAAGRFNSGPALYHIERRVLRSKMADKEKVIKGLECCMKWTGEPNTATCHCSDCSYTNMDVFGQRCLIDLINDALELLKEQEAVKPIVAFTRVNGTKAFSCPRCSALIRGGSYCSHCGQALKGERGEWE